MPGTVAAGADRGDRPTMRRTGSGPTMVATRLDTLTGFRAANERMRPCPTSVRDARVRTRPDSSRRSTTRTMPPGSRTGPAGITRTTVPVRATPPARRHPATPPPARCRPAATTPARCRPATTPSPRHLRCGVPTPRRSCRRSTRRGRRRGPVALRYDRRDRGTTRSPSGARCPRRRRKRPRHALRVCRREGHAHRRPRR